MDERRYLEQQKEQFQRHEALCQRCGSCCGAHGKDPCVHLKKETAETYYCDVYDTRLGAQVTVSGKPFTCVPIRNLRAFDSPYLECPYF